MYALPKGKKPITKLEGLHENLKKADLAARNFDITSWQKGKAPFGKSENVNTTINEAKTVYFIKNFELNSKPNAVRFICNTMADLYCM